MPPILLRPFFAALFGLALAATTSAQTATLEVPSEVTVGAEIPVSWTGPNAQGDFISLDLLGAAENEYGRYQYTKSGSPLTLRAPGEPGTFAVRYHSGAAGYAVQATAEVRVVSTTATVSVPPEAEVGQSIEITWTGPDHPGDFLSIDPPDAPEKQYGTYVYTKRGSPVSITLPNEPGKYLVRYHLGAAGYGVIGSAPIEIGTASAALELPASVDAGARVTVQWEGPGNEHDFISIDPPGAEDKVYGPYAYTRSGNPVEIQVPDEAGTYVVRYHLGGSGYPVIGSAPLRVGAVTATVRVEGPVLADEPFEVEWTGPDNRGDFITIVPAGTAEGEYGRYAYTHRGSPLRVQAPLEAGAHEVRYATGQSYTTLASVPVEVVPGAPKGTLRVFLGSESAADGGSTSGSEIGAVEVILDASGSMLQRLDGTRRIELARKALQRLTGETLPDGIPFALRVFGHEEADSCRTDLEIPLAPLDRARTASTLSAVEAKNLAKTPIADSLRQVRQDLANARGQRLVILVTDGEETCDGDPAKVIEELKAAGFDIRVNIVGFAIDELMVKEEFERWARLGGGRYFDAQDGAALATAVTGALATTYDVLQDGRVVASGSLGGESIELEPGDYQIRVGGRDAGNVKIVGKEETRFVVDG